eukprot:870052-Amphidinium_carterae.1
MAPLKPTPKDITANCGHNCLPGMSRAATTAASLERRSTKPQHLAPNTATDMLAISIKHCINMCGKGRWQTKAIFLFNTA